MAQPSGAPRPPVGGDLELSGLSRRFGAVAALSDFSLLVPAGSLCGFVGPNGAGKTTAMRIVLGVLEPDAGSVLFGGLPVDAQVRRLVGYVVSISLSDPDSPVAVILTFVPPLAPTIVPARAALGHLPLWQLAISVALSIGATFLLIRLAARLYSDGVLQTGAPRRLGRALRELRSA